MATNQTALRLVAAAMCCWLAAGLNHVLVLSVFGPQPVGLHVRWSPSITPDDRVRLEERFHLVEGERRDGRTYAYTLLDFSTENIRALVLEPAVEDTTNIDRPSFQLTSTADRRPWVTAHPLLPSALEALNILLLLAGIGVLALAILEFRQASMTTSSSTRSAISSARDVAERLGPAVPIVAALAPGAVLFSMSGRDLYSDEGCHFREIGVIREGEWQSIECLTTVAGYHVVVAKVGQWLSLPGTLDAARLVTVCASAVLFALFAICATRVGSRPGLKTMQLVALPILFPYTGLVYTDVAALLGLLLAAFFALRGQSLRAALALTLTLAVRQTHIVWGALLVAMCWETSGLWPQTRAGWLDARAWRTRLLAAWPFAIPVAAFTAFVVWNRGIAVGDTSAHAAGFYLGNPILAGLLFAMFFAPQTLVTTWHRLRRSPAAWLLALTCVALVMSRFAVTHPYNQATEVSFLRNRAILWFASGPGPKFLLALCVALGAVGLIGERVRLKVPLLLTAALSMVPFELIEHRYAIPAFAFFILLRVPGERWQERTSLTAMVCLAAYFVWGISAEVFNL
jgi:alpha-1,2-glucosyltransferase